MEELNGLRFRVLPRIVFWAELLSDCALTRGSEDLSPECVPAVNSGARPEPTHARPEADCGSIYRPVQFKFERLLLGAGLCSVRELLASGSACVPRFVIAAKGFRRPLAQRRVADA